MKYIGLDLGSRTLGVAISDVLGMLAHAYETFRFEEDRYDLAVSYTIELCKKEGVKTVVLGYPKHMNGDRGIRAHISEDFKEKIESQSDIKVVLADERLTTVIVDRAMISGSPRHHRSYCRWQDRPLPRHCRESRHTDYQCRLATNLPRHADRNGSSHGEPARTCEALFRRHARHRCLLQRLHV